MNKPKPPSIVALRVHCALVACDEAKALRKSGEITQSQMPFVAASLAVEMAVKIARERGLP